ncbi:MAG: SEC-C domain-containing protein [Planctomycetaceae bacterium]|jgi:preprotein translocase subunit SecA|nr:SEC-C domain-containing protein [Planctomycetaceae bacterium]
MSFFEDAFEAVGDFFTSVTRWIERTITSMFGAANARYIRQLQPQIDAINELEPAMTALTNDELKAKTAEFKERLARGATLDDILIEAFAVCREAGRRVLGLRHYDVQLMGGVVLHSGAIAEMVTGEGKTLVATLPAYLNSLTGQGVHVVTVNDYLARRDMEWMGPLYIALGVSVGTIQSNMEPDDRQKAYQCDITYGTNNEFGFDYLRDNMKFAARGDNRFAPTFQQVQGKLNFAIIDEVDNILIDEARTPLIIAGPAHGDVAKYGVANKIALQLTKGVDFEVNEKDHTTNLTDAGVRHAEKLAGVESFYTAGNMEWPHLIDNALKAHHLYKLDVNYMIDGEEIIIVDEFTGRAMPGRHWSDGLHQAVEAKERVKVKEENQTLATITLQNFFKLYDKISGMTGTGMTEASEFLKIYRLDVIAIPTNKPLRRVNYPDVIYKTEKGKFKAIVDAIERMHKWDILDLNGDESNEMIGTIVREENDRIEFTPKGHKQPEWFDKKDVKNISHKGRPILVGTVSIEKSELVSNMLDMKGIHNQVLNAKYHQHEAEIIAQAGRKGAVTIATNMAGRGTDIILGGNPEAMAWSILQSEYPTRLEVPRDVWTSLVADIEAREQMRAEGEEVRAMGGLHIIGTERHEARRIDLQLRGRTGRQGDPGTSRFYLSLEDDLMRIFGGDWFKRIMDTLGVSDGMPLEHKMLNRRIEGAQRKVEERNFDIRKNLLEYDEVMDFQRKSVYGYRQRILDGANTKELILEMIDEEINVHLGQFLDKDYETASFAAWIGNRFGVEFEPRDFRGMPFEAAKEFAIDAVMRKSESEVLEAIDENVSDEVDETEQNWQALANWSNSRWKTRYTDRDLRRIPYDELADVLIEKTRKFILSVDLSEGAELLENGYGIKMAIAWIKQKFEIEADFSDVIDIDKAAFIERVRQLTYEKYRDKEVQFPVITGLHHYTITDQSGRRYNREPLVEWARRRFNVEFDLEELKNRQRQEIEEVMFAKSRIASDRVPELYLELRRRLDELMRYNGIDPEALRKHLAAEIAANSAGGKNFAGSKFAVRSVAKQPARYVGKYSSVKDSIAQKREKEKKEKEVISGMRIQNDSHLTDFIEWANREFAGELYGGLTAEIVLGWEVAELEDRICSLIEDRYNPEMRQMERALILRILDTAWKDHLLVMDHLRSSIGLRGYAQEDPKVAFKRDGMKLFREMWDAVYLRVTDLVFKLEDMEQDVTDSVWAESNAVHEEVEANSVLAEARNANNANNEKMDMLNNIQTSDKKPEPIRNRGEHIARNAPCPCGSGKKYKQCCGKNK